MTDRELMQQALQALEFLSCDDEIDEALIVALRHRLEQPEQEPVAWADESALRWLADRKGKTSAHCTTQLSAARSFEQSMPIYTTPPRPEWVGLTDEETAECFEAKVISDRLKADAKRIEAKLKQKNGYDEEKNT